MSKTTAIRKVTEALPAMNGLLVGVHHDESGAPLFCATEDGGKMHVIATVDHVEDVIKRYRECAGAA
ncbi:hypothetical protein T8J41_13960 [Nitratireductor rhodophyticola]|uniref:hypothetical protein n=1 Tax=Nitratireductor rhodophyticola TaxID=2854036 RepID=UPI002AC8D244|nr:hypothetical protein [Nitratireductor rhodophyticola]WPZ13261.1 hypothetical protein T8J41_13960 [Nitratireductor rhodophyticola]